MTINIKRTLLLAAGLMAVCLLVAAPGTAAEPDPQAQPAEASTPATQAAPVAAAPAAGMLAFRDPVTGQLRPPTADELDAIRPQLEALFNQSSEGLEQIEMPDGSVMVDLQGRFASAVVATVAADGTVTTECVQSAEGLLEPVTPTDGDAPAPDTAGVQTAAVK